MVVTTLGLAVTTLFVDTIVVILLCRGGLVDSFNTLFRAMVTDLADFSVFLRITFGFIVFVLSVVVVIVVVVFCVVIGICVVDLEVFMMQLVDVHLNVAFFVSRSGFKDVFEKASKILEEL